MKNKFFEFYIENKNNYFFIEKEYGHYIIHIDDNELNDNLELIVEKDKNLIALIEYILTSKEMVKYSPIEELPLEMAIIKWCKI